MMTHILVVDDEAPIRNMLISFLESHGFKVEGAEDGSVGLKLARKLKPKIVLLDIKMPGMDGVENLRRLKQHVPESSVIMMSGHADEATALEALKIGAHDFIQKPFDLKYLERVLIVKMATA